MQQLAYATAGQAGAAIVISGAVIIGCLWAIGRAFSNKNRRR